MSRFAYAYILLLSSLSSISIINAQTPTNNPTSSPTTSAPSVNFFWVNWSKRTCEDTQPLPSGSQYLLNTAAFLHPDLVSCCDYHFLGEEYNDCITGGGGVLVGEDNWYVSYDLEACSKDCPIDPSTSECRGIIGKGTKIRYATEVACCEAQLGYIKSGLCQATSLGVPYTGSNLFYVDDSEHICLKDCETGNLCGGILTQGSRRTYDTIAECCQEGLPSITSEFCEAQSSGTDDGATDKWFAVSGLSYCKKDCTGTSICDRSGPYDRLFDTSAECCSEMYGYATPEYCQSRSEPGSVVATAGAYSNVWFASTAGYQDGLCVQDCDISTGNPACSEDLNPSDQVFDTPLKCCQQKLNWLAEDSCADASTAGSREDAPATNLWYPDYASLRRCVKDCAVDSAEPSCAGKIDIVGKTMYDDQIECCAKGFGWYDPTLCNAISLTGETNTNKWYHPYVGDTDACVQDCEVDSSSPTCGGQPSDLGIKTFDTPGECCDEKLSWADDCLFKSENGPNAPNPGSGKWYASGPGQCVKDCNDSSDDECGGLSEGSWNTLFDTSVECCDPSKNTRFNGQNAAQACECQGLDPDDPVACPAGQGDGRWYKSAASGPSRCVTNCPTSNGDPCGGVAENWVAQFFDSAEACCNTPEFQQLNSLEGCVLGA